MSTTSIVIHIASLSSFLITIILTGIFNQLLAIQIINIILSTTFIFYISFLVTIMDVKLLLQKFSLLFFYQTNIFIIHLLSMHTVLMVFYLYVIFYPYIVTYHDIKDIINTLFKIKCIILVCFIILNLISISLFLLIFKRQRKIIWDKIINIERILSFYDPKDPGFITMKYLSLTNESSYNINYTPKEFIEFWTNISEEDILQNIKTNAAVIFNKILEHVDINNDNLISNDEFIKFAEANHIIEHKLMWDMLTNYNESKYCQTKDYLTLSLIEEVVYNLDFLRQRFCLMIKTDYIIIQIFVILLSIALYSLAFVIICAVLNYSSAFGSGFDLFKIYVIAMTYLVSNIKNRIQFLWIMIWQRPFNIGDLVLIDNDPYKITDFNTGYSLLQGATVMSISNIDLMESRIKNLSKGEVIDSIHLQIPLNSHKCIIDKTKNLLINIATKNHEIYSDLIQCYWIKTEPTTKIMFCSWKYRIHIHDRYRYVKLKSSVTHQVISLIENEIGNNYMQTQIAQSGAYNYVQKYKIV